MKAFLVKKFKQSVSVTLAAFLLISATQFVCFAKEGNGAEGTDVPSVSGDFENYKKEHGNVAFGEMEICLDGSCVSDFSGKQEEYEGKQAFLLNEGDFVEYTVESLKDAKYELQLEYCSLK